MKIVMIVGINAPSRMAYVLMGELFFVEEIRLSGMLPTTKPNQGLLRSRMAYVLMGELFFIEEIDRKSVV